MDFFTPQTSSEFLEFLLFSLFTTVIYYLWKIRHRTKAVLPPSPARLPIIGHLHLLTDMPHHSFAELSTKLGPLIYLQFGQVPTILINSAHLARLVLKTYDHVFANRPQLITSQVLSFGCSDVSFSPYGPYWRQVRRICMTELLSPKRVNSFQVIRDEEVNRLLAGVLAESGNEVDISMLIFKLSNDILCRVAFGKRFKGESENLVEVFTETQNLFAGFCLGDFFPKWKWVNSVSGHKKRLMKNLQDLTRVCDEIIDEHLKKKKEEEESDDNSNKKKEDFIDVLLRVQETENLEVPITKDNLKAIVLDMFVAGTDTSAATLEFALAELIKQPRFLKKAQEEVRRVISGKGIVNETDLQHLHYMKPVIKETLRLHPTVPLLVPRESMEKCTLDDYEIPAKTRVIINSYGIHRDPQVWENPLWFNPERFVDNDIDIKDQDFRYLPFGGGRRGCPGYAFGLATVEITLARLLYHFDWALPDGVGPNDVDLDENFGLSTRKKNALLLVPTANKDYPFKGSNDI